MFAAHFVCFQGHTYTGVKYWFVSLYYKFNFCLSSKYEQTLNLLFFLVKPLQRVFVLFCETVVTVPIIIHLILTVIQIKYLLKYRHIMHIVPQGFVIVCI